MLDATLKAVRQRLRPILMTSLAFGFGVLPLAIGTGAGAGGRHAIGTAVLGGMVVGTALGIFFVPLFFVTDHAACYRAPPAGGRPAPSMAIAGRGPSMTRRLQRMRALAVAWPDVAPYCLSAASIWRRTTRSPMRPYRGLAGRASQPASTGAVKPSPALDPDWRDFFLDERLRGVVAAGAGQ